MIKYDEKLQQYVVDEENANRFTSNDFDSIESLNKLRELKSEIDSDEYQGDDDGLNPLCFAALNNVDPLIVLYMVSKKENLIPKYLVNEKPVTAKKNGLNYDIEFNDDYIATVSASDQSLLLKKKQSNKNIVKASIGKLEFYNNDKHANLLFDSNGFELINDANSVRISSSEIALSNSDSTYKFTFDDEFGIVKNGSQIVKFADSKIYIGNNCIAFNGTNMSIDTGSTFVSLDNYTDLIVNGSKFITLTNDGFKIAVSINNIGIDMLINSSGILSIKANGLSVKLDGTAIRVNNVLISLMNKDGHYSLAFNGIEKISLKDNTVSLSINEAVFSVSLSDNSVNTTIGNLSYIFNKSKKEVSLVDTITAKTIFKAEEKSTGFAITVGSLMLDIIKDVGVKIIDSNTNIEILSAYKRINTYTVKFGTISCSIDIKYKSITASFNSIGTVTALCSSPNSFSLSYSYSNSSIKSIFTIKSNEFIFSINDFKFTVTFVPINILINGVSLTDKNLFWGTDTPLKGLGYSLQKKSKGKTPLQYAIMSGNVNFIDTVLNKKSFKVPILFGRGSKNDI